MDDATPETVYDPASQDARHFNQPETFQPPKRVQRPKTYVEGIFLYLKLMYKRRNMVKMPAISTESFPLFLRSLISCLLYLITFRRSAWYRLSAEFLQQRVEATFPLLKAAVQSAAHSGDFILLQKNSRSLVPYQFYGCCTCHVFSFGPPYRTYQGFEWVNALSPKPSVGVWWEIELMVMPSVWHASHYILLLLLLLPLKFFRFGLESRVWLLLAGLLNVIGMSHALYILFTSDRDREAFEKSWKTRIDGWVFEQQYAISTPLPSRSKCLEIEAVKSGLLRMNLRRAKGWRRLPFIMCMDKLHSKRDANLSNPNNLNGRLKLLTWSVLNCDIDSILNVGDRIKGLGNKILVGVNTGKHHRRHILILKYNLSRSTSRTVRSYIPIISAMSITPLTRATFIAANHAQIALSQKTMYELVEGEEGVKEVPIPESFKKSGIPQGYSVDPATVVASLAKSGITTEEQLSDGLLEELKDAINAPTNLNIIPTSKRAIEDASLAEDDAEEE
ncbi:hypothetical protein K443DRAFT_122294 [Laccaria amethystina LaAM-08-1]|uniref:Uncharacterized protein n=1 Tax=Laccaria amethystina LaAM-08-1 TaxID=1095629 RepID=A0A0C9Y0U2_9AGAR|nr:hypothetical protein K443DRAFT_122294 [Laccaria amethystina LaAM-08-1]